MANGVISLGTSGYLTAQIVWSSVANGTVNNNSTVTATLQARRTNNYTTTGTWSGSLNIGGTTKTFSTHLGISSSWVNLLSFSITKAHSADGKGTCYIYGKIAAPSGTSMAGTVLSNSQTVTLDNIIRQATITDAPNFNDEDNPVLKYSNPAGNSVTTLQACIASTDGAVIYAPYRDISKTGSSYTFNLTDAERNALRNATTTSNSKKFKFYVQTLISGATYRETKEITLTIVNANPTLDPVVKDVNDVTKALTENDDRLIKFYSNASFAFNAAGVKGATIKSYKLTCGGKSSTSASGVLNNIEDLRFVFTVTDSRGNTTTKTLYKTVYEYIKLTCDLVSELPNTSGVLNFAVKGNYYFDNFGATGYPTNPLNVYYRYKESGGTYSNWIETTSITKEEGKYNANITITGLDYRKAYTIQAYSIDALSGNVESKEVIVKATPVFDWSEDDFNFNVPISFNGVIMRDYLIEQGTIDNFNYRKWSGGVIEMWYSTTINTAVSTAYGNGFYNGTPLEIDFPSDALKTKPIVSLSIEPSNAQIYNINVAAVSKDSLAYYISSYQTQAESTLQVNLHLYAIYN